MPEPGDDVEESEDDGAGLYWVALYLVDLVYGGAEEGGWWYQAGTLVVSPETYHEIGGASAAFLERGEAIAYRERLEPSLANLNAGRPPIEATNSVGIYELRLTRAQLLPTHFPDRQPHYEWWRHTQPRRHSMMNAPDLGDALLRPKIIEDLTDDGLGMIRCQDGPAVEVARRARRNA